MEQSTIVEMNPDMLKILRLFLEKLELLDQGERSTIKDAIKLYIYPKYIIERSVVKMKSK